MDALSFDLSVIHFGDSQQNLNVFLDTLCKSSINLSQDLNQLELTDYKNKVTLQLNLVAVDVSRLEQAAPNHEIPSNLIGLV